MGKNNLTTLSKENGHRAVDLGLTGSSIIPRSANLSVTGDATVRNVLIEMSRTGVAGPEGTALFNSDLKVEGATQIKAGNNSTSPVNATLELKGALNKFAQDITLNDQAGGNAYLTLSGSVDQTIGRVSNAGTNRIKAASDGEGTIKVLNDRDGQAPSRATFDIAIGHDDANDANDKRLKQLTVGESSKGGHAIFNRGVHVDNIDVISGNHTNEVSTVEFCSDVSGDRIRLTDGNNTDGTSIPKATAIFNARDNDITVETKIISAALEKGLDILELLATQSRRLSKTQIAHELGRSTSEIFRMLGCLESRGYIGEQAPGDGYRLTMRLHDLVNKWPPHARLVSTALPEMRVLAEKTLQSCHLGVVNSGKLYIAAQADSPLPIGLNFKIGSEFPLLRTASDRVLLAFQSKKVSDFLIASLTRQEKNLSLKTLCARLDTIKEDGIEVSESDRVEGLIDLSCPITNAQGTAIAALTVPFLNLLTRDVDIESVTAQLKQTATAISDFMGAENLL